LGQDKGFLEVDLKSKEVKFHSVHAREMIELAGIDAKELNPEQVLLEIEKRVSTIDITEKIVRLKVKEIPEDVYNSLDFRMIGELKSKAFHFDLKFEKKEEKAAEQSGQTSIGKLNREFEQFLGQIAVENLDKDRILEMALAYLMSESEEQEETVEIDQQIL
jgi:hypothetical protein